MPPEPAEGPHALFNLSRLSVWWLRLGIAIERINGFFFEIVERRGGYSGYGASNAPFRIAAQKRELPPKGMPKF